VVRLAKFWARRMKQERDGFRFKSFMIEMTLAKLCDDGLDFSDYPEALQHLFTYIARTDFRRRIVFGDYYAVSSVGNVVRHGADHRSGERGQQRGSPLQPRRTRTRSSMPLLMPETPCDAALAAPNKQLTVAYWQKVFGSSFQA